MAGKRIFKKTIYGHRVYFGTTDNPIVWPPKKTEQTSTSK